MPPLKVWSHAFRLMSTAALRQAVLLRLVFGQASCSCTVAISPVHTQARALLNLRRAVSWMPRLRSATSQIQEQFGSNAIACGPAPQASECHLQHQQDGDKPDVQPEQTSPAARKPAQKQRKRATSSKMPVMTVESASDAASPETAMQQTPRKKVKVRKALLSTLWTTDQLVPLQTKVEKLYIQLNELYKDPPCPLNFDSPFQLLVAVILSAQSTDKKVNEITPALFKLAPDAHAMAALEVGVVQQLIKQIGLAPTKAKNICNTSKMLVEEHDGVVPETFEELEKLPGVGHKTASVVICTAFGTPTFPVDTHIYRLALRWGLTEGKTVEQAEADLKVLLAEDKWNNLHLRFIYFGREHCPAQRHDPSSCPICSWAAVPPHNKVLLPKRT